MELRSINKEELEHLKLLVGQNEYFDSNNIWLEQSKICIANNGDILGFVLVKPNSLIDFFGGNIPANNKVNERRKWRRKTQIEYYANNHYETLFYIKTIGNDYLESDEMSDLFLQYLLSHAIEEDKNGDLINGLFWSRYEIPQYVVNFKSYNDIVYIDIIPRD